MENSDFSYIAVKRKINYLIFILFSSQDKKQHILYYKVKMQIIVVSFLYHVCPKKAIAHVVSKIKTADHTNAQTFHW